MMKVKARGWFAAMLCFAAVTGASAQGLRGSQPQAVQAERPVDGIAAVVNKEVITVLQVEERAKELAGELRAQRLPVPPQNEMLKGALDELITQTVVAQEAESMGLRVTDRDLERALERVAQRNGLSVAQLRAQVSRIGLDWEDYEDTLRRQILFDMVRQRMADMTVRVSDADVDAFLKEREARKASGLEPPPPPPPPPPKPRPAQPLVLQISQIFVSVPESASEAQVAELRKKIDGIRARLRSGEKFSDLAIEVSDGAEASRGGDLGVRPASGWPEIFLRVARNLQPGQISGVIRSPAGFHILQVTGRAGGQPATPPPPPQQAQPKEPTGPMMVQQTKARHILIKTSTVMSDDQAKQRLLNARSRIVQGGESFEDVARVVSEDNSAPLGGDLGWLNPGETVPEFERAMDSLDPGEISEPVKSPFGWHLIVVEQRRSQDMAEQYRRNMARQELYERRARAQFEAWLQQMRNVAFIDNRMFRQTEQ
ncbi:peptidylprolyl isomerase [Orrella daihaiensis]|uniref:Chaperone SurA n=1 Tax=Orrella daihaiensis TaxID=2782176 RepID=A0ABY4AJY1_9BURK|nr:peptidylprolyl isomerase [Orrella daihaiensis]UOD49961.1 peptidylprolyl isomerase [Orrella daihaiensis]